MSGGKCCCVTACDCQAPANGSGTIRTRCFACGDYVCRECSRVLVYLKWNRKRICNRCEEDWRRS